MRLPLPADGTTALWPSWGNILLTTGTLVVQVEQSVRCVCVVLCESGQLTFELSDLSHRYLACWFFLTLSRSSSKVKVSQSSRSHEENVAKVVGATSSEGFLV